MTNLGQVFAWAPGLFQPEIVAPEQWGRRPARPPSWYLWAAVLMDAASIYVGTVAARTDEREAARLWIETASSEVGGFDWVASTLGLEPSRLRRVLIKVVH